jgi:hypothetical protein
MIEVMTIDSSGNVKNLEPVTDSNRCKSVGKLFIVAEDGSLSEGAVFLIHPENYARYSLPADKLVCLTDFHNLGELFDRPESFFVSFENVTKSQVFKSVLKHTQSVCPQNLFKARPAMLFNHISGCRSVDPITTFDYSVENDVEFLVLENECSCGKTVVLPNYMIPLRIKELDVAKTITLVGFPGNNVLQSRAIPYSDIDPGNSYITAGNELKQCTGRVIKANEDLIAIENSSVAGMSGSPILQIQDGEWVAVSILLGGPAVINHYELTSMSRHVLQHNFSEALQLLESIKKNQPHCCIDSILLMLEWGLLNAKEEGSLLLIRDMYFGLIKNYAKLLTPEDSVKILSHNLGFRLKKLFS